MAGPFPGMDPYIEAQANWPDFHNSLIAEIRNSLGVRLPDDYVARVDERIEIADFEGPTGPSYRPDVLIAREGWGGPSSQGSEGGGTAVATIEPITVAVLDHHPDEIRVTWVEVRRLPDMELVTAIEVRSPVNKTGSSQLAYLAKRHALHTRKVNTVEIDLLLGGYRLPTWPKLSTGHYFAVVARGPALPNAEVYGWTVRHRLPTIPIPLRGPDPDVPIDLQELVNRVYDLGRYRRTLHHNQALPEVTPIHPEDRAWVEGAAKPRGV